MKFSPSLYQALLSLRKITCNHCNLRYAVNCGMLLIIGVKMGHVMNRRWLCIHANDNTKKARKLWHGITLSEERAERNNWHFKCAFCGQGVGELGPISVGFFLSS